MSEEHYFNFLTLKNKFEGRFINAARGPLYEFFDNKIFLFERISFLKKEKEDVCVIVFIDSNCTKHEMQADTNLETWDKFFKIVGE